MKGRRIEIDVNTMDDRPQSVIANHYERLTAASVTNDKYPRRDILDRQKPNVGIHESYDE
jgi:hypothetical protein